MFYMADDISSNIDNSHAATAQGTVQLRKASKTQQANSSLVQSQENLSSQIL